MTQSLCCNRLKERRPGIHSRDYIQMLVQQSLKHTMIQNRKDSWLKGLALVKKHTLFLQRLTKRLRLNPKLSREISFALGQPAEEKLVQQRQAIREAKQRLKEAQRLEKTLNETEAKQQQAAQEKQAKEAQLEQINRRITNMENEGGTVIERQNEIDRLKRQKSKLERDIEEEKEKNKEYGKTIKERGKAAKDVERLQKKLADEEQKKKCYRSKTQQHKTT